MKVFYKATDRDRLSDPSFKFYASAEHPDLKGHPVASTGYNGPTENVITGDEPTQPEAAQPAPEVPTEEPTPEPSEEPAPEPAEEPTPIEEAPAPVIKKPAKKSAKKPAKKASK